MIKLKSIAACLLGTAITAVTVSSLVMPSPAQADVQHLDDVIIGFSLCTGNDCNNGESFGFDTMRLKENNLRIHFDDTSTSASFPNNDWRIVINDSSNGGGNYFAIEDSSAGRQPFRVDAGSPANSIRVDSAGDVGFGTSNPVVNLHVVDGNTPTLRLEQDGSSGFTPQTWDLAGNEANFFIRDATNGSNLPFKIKPGADHNAIYIDAVNNIGLRTASPNARLHINKDGGEEPSLLINTDGSSNTTHMIVDAAGLVGIGLDTPTTALHVNERTADTSAKITLSNSTDGTSWEWVHRAASDEKLAINNPGNTGAEYIFGTTGDLVIAGSMTATSFIAGTTTLSVPDYVFDYEYKLKSLDDLEIYIKNEKHLPNIPSATEIKRARNLDITKFQMKLLEKIEELTLYTLQLNKQVKQLESELTTLKRTKKKS